MKTLMEKKSVILVDEAPDWLQIWTAASSLDVKGNKAIKKKFVFLVNRFVFPNTVTYRHHNRLLNPAVRIHGHDNKKGKYLVRK